MIPTSDALSAWLRHISGQERLTQNLIRSDGFVGSGLHRALVEERAEFEKSELARIIEGAAKCVEAVASTFGVKQFPALVGFIDMRGFSDLACGKSPVEIHQIVTPFIQAVTRCAKRFLGFVDKTIGDEVMVVFPWFQVNLAEKRANVHVAKLFHHLAASEAADEVHQHESTLGRFFKDALSGKEMSHVSEPERTLSEVGARILCAPILPLLFVAELTVELQTQAKGVAFSSGFGFGEVVLAEVRSDEYKEWTVYGNCVNAAKRLQSVLPLQSGFDNDIHQSWTAVGAIESEIPQFDEELEHALKNFPSLNRGELIQPIIATDTFKGVGRIAYLTGSVKANAPAK